MRIPDPPVGLTPASSARWPDLAGDVLAANGGAAVDLDLLADVLRCCDRLTAVSAIVDREGLTVAGSQGQIRPHPLLVIESALRHDVAAGYDRLRLTPRTRPEGDLEITRFGRLTRAR